MSVTHLGVSCRTTKKTGIYSIVEMGRLTLRLRSLFYSIEADWFERLCRGLYQISVIT